MNICLMSNIMPISLNLIGNIVNNDIHWYLRPMYSALQKQDIEKLNQSIYKFKIWSNSKHYKLTISAPFLFKLAFFLFSKKEEYIKKQRGKNANI